MKTGASAMTQHSHWCLVLARGSVLDAISSIRQFSLSPVRSSQYSMWRKLKIRTVTKSLSRSKCLIRAGSSCKSIFSPITVEAESRSQDIRTSSSVLFFQEIKLQRIWSWRIRCLEVITYPFFWIRIRVRCHANIMQNLNCVFNSSLKRNLRRMNWKAAVIVRWQ